MEEYATTFTIHGLSKVYNGNTLERCLWSACVLTAFFCTAILITSYITKYQKHEVYQTVSQRQETTAYFPQVTFCLKNFEPSILRYKCKHYGLCDQVVPKDQLWNKPNNSLIWSNNVFIIEQVDHVPGISLRSKINPKDVVSHEELNGTCITWHTRKTIYQDFYRGNMISVTLYVPENIAVENKKVTVSISEQNVSGILRLQDMDLDEGERYYGALTKKIVIRKPSPFPSNCIHKIEEHSFPGLYSQRVCSYVKNEIQLYQKHVYTNGFTMYLIPKDELSKSVNVQSHCLPACEETRFDISWVRLERYTNYCHISDSFDEQESSFSCVDKKANKDLIKFVKFSLYLRYQHPEFSTIIAEEELYSLNEMLGDIGGFLGLVIGASLISLVELIVFAILAALRKFHML